ncbi:class I adenylate-forming enzyme family protein [Alkalihalobacillus sp. TS-13]|uniref:class I adenylate-forming enzyme family protein n=1 Tax=Alkalihalobacillus sp. TS-13 TaxID=2842455 RepID=UPI001C87C904|nr:long-chain-fatty-acid--CoA ligase [Alkalihalobacillus sp. TS-13]
MNLGLSLSRNATRLPNKEAIVCEGRSFTYSELNREVNRLANGFIARGLSKGDKVAMMMKNSDQFVMVFYALMKAGAVAVPINFRLTASEVEYLLNDSDAKMVVFDEEFAEVMHRACKETPMVELKICAGKKAFADQLLLDSILSSDDCNPDVEVLESDDCEILYTSGTTGRPKGALFDHHRVFHVGINLTAMMGLTVEDRVIHIAPLYHCAQLNLFMVLSTFLGCTQVIYQDFDPVQTLKAFEEHRISVFFGVPTMYNFFLQVPNGKEFDLSSVRKCAYGAAPMPLSLLEKSMDLFSHKQFYNLCGLTEGGPGGVCLTPSRHLDKIGAGGTPIPNTEVRVVDETGEDVATGQIGEFIIRGETVMKEYYNKSEETQETFRDGWLYTGDLATMDEEGYITLVDRKKDMIISGGENVYSTEVEQAIYAHPDVLETAVIGIPHEVWGETVAAVIVPQKEAVINPEEIKAFCREKLAGYKVPRMFYQMEQLPRNASGKVLKFQLRKHYIEQQAKENVQT